MKQILGKILLLLGVTSFLASCATTSLVDTWRSPEAPRAKLHNLLVMGITKIGEKRRVYEDLLASELKARGVEAVPGYTLIPDDGKVDRQTLEKAVKKSGAEAVLTVQTIRVERHVVVQPAYVYPDYWYPGLFPSWDFYGYYDSMFFYEPPYVSTYDVASIQVNLFGAQSGRLIWAGNIETSAPGKIVTVGKDIARLVVRELAREGLI